MHTGKKIGGKKCRVGCFVSNCFLHVDEKGSVVVDPVYGCTTTRAVRETIKTAGRPHARYYAIPSQSPDPARERDAVVFPPRFRGVRCVTTARSKLLFMSTHVGMLLLLCATWRPGTSRSFRFRLFIYFLNCQPRRMGWRQYEMEGNWIVTKVGGIDCLFQHHAPLENSFSGEGFFFFLVVAVVVVGGLHKCLGWASVFFPHRKTDQTPPSASYF